MMGFLFSKRKGECVPSSTTGSYRLEEDNEKKILGCWSFEKAEIHI